MKESRLYKIIDNECIQCEACAHGCKLKSGQTGICGVRKNQDGKLYSLVYGKAIATHVDPIEKKPLFHFLPGSKAFSIATVGCNMHCHNCQNAEISQMPKDQGRIMGSPFAPEEVVQSAKETGCQTIAFTYTEPAVYWDYAFDIAQLSVEQNLKNIFVTNGYLSEKSLAAIAPYLHGANVDLKAFTDASYRSICGARLQPVLDTIYRMHELEIWIEITTLLIPGFNDSKDELQQIARFIQGVDPGIPWHISRFYPTYKMLDRHPTSVSAVQEAREIGLNAGLRYVITGNIPGDSGENTYCYQCGEMVIQRIGYDVVQNKLENGFCPVCKAEIDGVWKF